MWATRISIFVLPPLSFVITKRICLALQRADRDLVLHGRETGRLVMLPHGEFVEIHEELSAEEAWTRTSHEQLAPIPAAGIDANGVRAKGVLKDRIRARISKGILQEQIAKPTAKEKLELGDGHH
jgi:ubiquinol-cytochrome c reductase cytochrome b subunit